MSALSPIRVMLVDDHTLFRTGIKLLLQRQAEITVVGEAPDGLEAVKRLRELKPDVVLLDLNMPGLSGLKTLELLLQDAPDTAVIMLTVSEDAEDLGAALRTGARGYLLKNIEAQVLVQGIVRAYRGEAVVAEQMTSKLVAQFKAPAPHASATGSEERLTPREKEILIWLARGESNKEIARQLGVAESTVKIHVQNILKKLKLSSRVQAAVYAVEHGFMPAPSA